MVRLTCKLHSGRPELTCHSIVSVSSYAPINIVLRLHVHLFLCTEPGDCMPRTQFSTHHLALKYPVPVYYMLT